MVMNGKLLQPSDHMMIGVTACMLFICYKMMWMYPFAAGMLMWFNMKCFDVYCLWRKSGNM